MSGFIHGLVEQYGLAAVFLGCVAEGETAAILAGFFAHQQVFEPWQAYLAAFLGAFTGDSLLFLAGRRFADHPRVASLRARPGFRHAFELVGRHPNLFVLGNRYVYGLRVAGGIAAGLSSIPVPRFLALNALSSAIWAALFGSFGYFLGAGAEQILGKALHEHERLLAAILIAALTAAAIHVVLRRRRT